MTDVRSRAAWADASLSALLAVQALTLFVSIPLAAGHPAARLLFEAGHLAFAAVCVVALTRRWLVRAALLAGLLALASGPAVLDRLGTRLGAGPAVAHALIALVAFAFNALVTALVAWRTFGPGRVTVHRVQGALLVYLNVAALFAIAYGLLEAHAPGAIVPTVGGVPGDTALAPGARTAALSYFSLATITTTGFGDLVPVHPLARSLANLEAVFGQLFPATLLARLVALQLAHAAAPDDDDRRGDGRGDGRGDRLA